MTMVAFEIGTRQPLAQGQSFGDAGPTSRLTAPRVSRSIGASDQLLSLMGGTVPFAATASRRAASGNPRPAIAECYRDAADYRARVRCATDALIETGYLLPEDRELVIDEACGHYRFFLDEW
jgi:hypothetical protein